MIQKYSSLGASGVSQNPKRIVQMFIFSFYNSIIRLGIATRKWGILTFGGTGYPFSNFNGDRLCQLNVVTNSDGEQRFRLSCFEYSGDKPPGCYGVVLVPDEENDCVYLMGGTNGHEYYYDVYRGKIQETPNGNFHVTWARVSVSAFYIKLMR